MAVIHVSSWNDFKTAITGEANTVILDSDIDASGDIINNRINVKALEIDGQGHTIYNYTSTHNGSDFYIDFYYQGNYITCAIKNLNFFNIVVGGESRSEAFFKAYHGRFTLTNCRFQGAINKELIQDCTMRQCSCSFTKLRYIGGISDDNSIEECWFDIGNNICTSNESYYRGNIKYCYFKGSLDTKSIKSGRDVFNGFCTSSIFNLELSDSSENIKTINLFSRDASNICLYNTDKLSFPANVTLSDKKNFTGLSDASLKNPEAVNATGFNPFVMWGANCGIVVHR